MNIGLRRLGIAGLLFKALHIVGQMLTWPQNDEPYHCSSSIVANNLMTAPSNEAQDRSRAKNDLARPDTAIVAPYCEVHKPVVKLTPTLVDQLLSILAWNRNVGLDGAVMKRSTFAVSLTRLNGARL